MPPPKSGPALFLGIELSTDQLRASIVDESLELVGVESIDFDIELSEYQCVLLLSPKTPSWAHPTDLLSITVRKAAYSQRPVMHIPLP